MIVIKAVVVAVLCLEPGRDVERSVAAGGTDLGRWLPQPKSSQPRPPGPVCRGARSTCSPSDPGPVAAHNPTIGHVELTDHEVTLGHRTSWSATSKVTGMSPQPSTAAHVPLSALQRPWPPCSWSRYPDRRCVPDRYRMAWSRAPANPSAQAEHTRPDYRRRRFGFVVTTPCWSQQVPQRHPCSTRRHRDTVVRRSGRGHGVADRAVPIAAGGGWRSSEVLHDDNGSRFGGSIVPFWYLAVAPRRCHRPR